MNERPPKDPTTEELEQQEAQPEKKKEDGIASMSDKPLTSEEWKELSEHSHSFDDLSELLKGETIEGGEENVAAWLKIYEAPEAAEAKATRESTFKLEGFIEMVIEKFRNMIADFEATHSLEELNAIIELTPEESEHHPLRTPARKALNPIGALLNRLGGNIPEEQYKTLKAEYKRLSRAVGVIDKDNKVDHTR